MVYFPQYIENLKSAARDGDLVVLKKQAHSMKGSSASLGMKTLSDYAKELHSATCTDPEEIQRLIALISEELRQNEQIFKDFTG